MGGMGGGMGGMGGGMGGGGMGGGVGFMGGRMGSMGRGGGTLPPMMGMMMLDQYHHVFQATSIAGTVAA